jgi:sugar O-acyltransferase (sialic acid O-acetyltransferase NeuD family)
MATEILLPKLGMNTEEATIVAWRKREGDTVAVGDVLADVETDKAVIELEAEAAGTLRHLLAADGERVATNQPIAIVGSADEDTTALLAKLAAPVIAETSHVEQVYQAWKGDACRVPAASVAHQAATVSPPAARRERQGGALDLAAIRARLAQRGIVGGDGASGRAGERASGYAAVIDTPKPIKTPQRTRIVIYGAGLGAKQLLEITRQLDTIEVIGLIDDKPGMAGTAIGGTTILGGFEALKSLVARGAVDGVALSFHSEVRRKVHRKIAAALDIRFVPLVDPRAHVGADVQIGDGALIEAGAVVGPGTIVGEGVIVDVGAIVAHDCSLGAFSHLSPGCALSGVVCLKENVLVSVGASINSTVTVGRNVIITPGAAVMNDLPDDVIVGGVPAKVMGASRRGE